MILKAIILEIENEKVWNKLFPMKIILMILFSLIVYSLLIPMVISYFRQIKPIKALPLFPSQATDLSFLFHMNEFYPIDYFRDLDHSLALILSIFIAFSWPTIRKNTIFWWFWVLKLNYLFQFFFKTDFN